VRFTYQDVSPSQGQPCLILQKFPAAAAAGAVGAPGGAGRAGICRAPRDGDPGRHLRQDGAQAGATRPACLLRKPASRADSQPLHHHDPTVTPLLWCYDPDTVLTDPHLAVRPWRQPAIRCVAHHTQHCTSERLAWGATGFACRRRQLMRHVRASTPGPAQLMMAFTDDGQVCTCTTSH
jgi:hypothetical protein